MSKRITDEQIEQINEVYFQCKIKSQTAKIVGVSVASVTKYLIDDYVPKAMRVKIDFDGTPKGITEKELEELTLEKFLANAVLSKEEWEELKKLQKEIY